MSQHNHITRDIKAPGQCPACDDAPAARVAAGPMANQAWHMLALHQYAEDIAKVMHLIAVNNYSPLIVTAGSVTA